MRRIVLITALAALVAAFAAQPSAGMGKPRVAALQIGLQAKGLYGGTIDGVWGPATARAVRRLQRRAQIAVDGVPGPQTRKALGRLGRPDYRSRTLVAGRAGWDVSVTQFLLAWHGFPSGPLDGHFGERTRSAVMRFQRHARIGVDGRVGPGTYAALGRPLPRAGMRLRRPLRIAPTDRFGPRGNRFHTGLDYPASHGARVRAAAGGVVVTAGWDPGGYGNLVVVRHANGRRTWYAHLSALSVGRGARVAAGQLVGLVGATGSATGPHLHFELRFRGAAVNPLPALG